MQARARKPLATPIHPDNWLRLRLYPVAKKLEIAFHPTFQVLRRSFSKHGKKEAHPTEIPDDRELVQQQMDRATRDSGGFGFEHRLLLPDGSVKHVRVTAHPSRDSAGNLEFVGAVTDISDQRRAEESVRESEAYLAEAQRLSHTGSWAWSPEQDIRSWSEECYRVLGFDPQDGFPRKEDYYQRIHPDDQPGFMELIQTAIREKADWETDLNPIGCAFIRAHKEVFLQGRNRAPESICKGCNCYATSDELSPRVGTR